jgi:hypothetical protein
MGRSRLSGGLVVGLAVLAAGCGGGGKGSDMQMSETQGAPDAARDMGSSTPTTDAGRRPTTDSGTGGMMGACGQGSMCTGIDGCVSSCDPATNLVTACAACDNTTFTDCTQSTCQP